MNGRMKKYKLYLKSLTRMKEPEVPKAKIDMRGALAYARSRGTTVGKLSEEEKARFIQYL